MDSTQSFLEAWHSAMFIGMIVMGAAGVIVYLVYRLRVSMITDFKEKHDFINSHEINWYKFSYYCFGLAFAMWVNTYGKDKFDQMGVWFYVRIFFSLAAATLVGYVASLILDYYYPTRINAKLRKWRYVPRINPKTGNKMRLLTEDEEDVHLDEGMQAEENVFSIDYDVWLDEKTGDLKIEKYEGHLTALQCHNCGFYTMRVIKEEIIEKHEDGTPAELLKHYKCQYCKNIRATQFHISQKESEDYKSMKPRSRKHSRDIEAIRIEIHSSVEGKKYYEFQNVEEARKFLAEFDFDKVV